MHTAVELLVYATPVQDTIQEGTYEDGVYFNEFSIFEHTRTS